MPIIKSDTSVSEFLKDTEELLYKNEAANNSILGICGNILSNYDNPKPSPLFIRVVDGQKVLTAAILIFAKYLVITSATDDQLKMVANFLKEKKLDPPGIWGPQRESEIFSGYWEELSGVKAVLAMDQKVYQVDNIILPKNVPGILRGAKINEVEIIANGLYEFSQESLLPYQRMPLEKLLKQAEILIKNQQSFVWENKGCPVSMAYVGRPTQNGIGISAVYTPKDQRKRGYAGALVGNLSQKMLDSGKKFCVLFTDMKNPSSNRLYQNIGYQEVMSVKHFTFD